MTRDQVYAELNKIFQDIFDDENISVHDTTTANDIEDWDSLEHINLVAAIENKFGIKFAMSEVNGMQNVGVMVDTILKRTV